MTPEAQRIAIAEVCGWTKCRLAIKGAGAPERYPSPYGFPPGRNYEAPVTMYERDLNAMHEAEKVLDVTNGGPTSGDCLRYAYSGNLYRLVPEWQQPFRATAAQRAEAFLRTIGKWEDESAQPAKFV